MYWNNCWLNNFNFKNFLNKTLFLENLFSFLFCEKIFRNFFTKRLEKSDAKSFYFKNVFFKKIRKKFYFKKDKLLFYKRGTKLNLNTHKSKKYNFTKVWFIKYNNFILATLFVYFYFKIRGKKIQPKKKSSLQRAPSVFWKKRRGPNLKKKLFLKRNYFMF